MPKALAISALYFGVAPSETNAIGISAGFVPFTRILYAISAAFTPQVIITNGKRSQRTDAAHIFRPCKGRHLPES